jgi:hypothetical protein
LVFANQPIHVRAVANAVPMLLLAGLGLAACAPRIDPGTLRPTLTIEESPAGLIAWAHLSPRAPGSAWRWASSSER